MSKGTISKTTFVKGIAAGGIVLASLGALSFGEYKMKKPAAEDSSGAAVSEASVEGTALTPGTYRSRAAGIQSDVIVECIFDEAGITDMTIDVSGETPGLGADIGDQLKQQILDAQSNDVDGVAGCTITSDAIRQATASCIGQASGEIPIEVWEEETEAPATEAGQTDIIPAGEPETDAAEPLSEAEGPSEAEAPAPQGTNTSFVPGTYTASAPGISSDVTVSATFDETAITDLSVDVSGETPDLGQAIGDEMISRFLEAQSPDVDGVAGCTITSDALKTALADCISQALPEDGEAEETEGISAEEDMTEIHSETPAADVEPEPGSYRASAAGLQSDITVTIHTADSQITEADIDVSGETDGIGAAIGDLMANRILRAQSSDIDGIAGATITSDAILTALKDCLAQAEQDGIVISAPAAEEAPEETAAESAAETEENTEVSESETAGEAAVFQASAQGMQSEVIAEVSMIGEQIQDVRIDVSKETDGIGAAVGDILRRRILDAQSAEIDGVAGATITSDAVLQAVRDCLAEAAAGGQADGEQGEEKQYTASAQGLQSEVTVTLTYTGSRISDAAIDVSGETDGIGAAAGPILRQYILDAQSADVDTVAGATITSEAVIAAAEECIKQAASPSPVSDMEEESEPDVPDASAAEGTTYTASAEGMTSDVTVTCVFADGTLSSVDIDVSGETPEIGAAVGDIMETRLMEAGSADVDTVSGATITSGAVLAAFQDCLNQAILAGEGEQSAETETEG